MITLSGKNKWTISNKFVNNIVWEVIASLWSVCAICGIWFLVILTLQKNFGDDESKKREESTNYRFQDYKYDFGFPRIFELRILIL